MSRFVMLSCFVGLLATSAQAADTEPVELTGTIHASERVQLRSRITSTVVKIHVEAGAAVKKGDLLFTLDDRLPKLAVEKAEAEVKLAEAQIQFKAKNLERIRALLQKGAVTKEEFDQATSELTAAEAKLKVAKTTLDQGTIELGFTRITAPIDGRLDPFQQITTGNTVTADKTVLAGISNVDPLVIHFNIDEATLPRLQKALGDRSVKEAKVPIKVSLPTDKEPSLKATLDVIDSAVDAKTRTLRARAVLANAGNKVLPGQLVKLQIELPKK